MNETQADKIITLLESIDNRLERLEKDRNEKQKNTGEVVSEALHEIRLEEFNKKSIDENLSSYEEMLPTFGAHTIKEDLSFFKKEKLTEAQLNRLNKLERACGI